MADGKIPQGERYVQLNIKDMFSGRRGSSSSSNGRGGSRGGSPSNRNGPIRNRGTSSSPRNSPGSSARRGRDREGNFGKGRRLDEVEVEEDESTSQSTDVEMEDAEPVVFYKMGTSSMLRAAGGAAATMGEHFKANAQLVVGECGRIAEAIFGKDAGAEAYLYNKDIEGLPKDQCPEYRLPHDDVEAGNPGCRIRVVNQDVVECAEEMIKRYNFEQSQLEIARTRPSPNDEASIQPGDNGVLVLNMANKRDKGGGFTNGSIAQEEALMQRCTLWHTLPSSWYTWADTECVYSPYVAIHRKFREKLPDGSFNGFELLERANAILTAASPVADANKAQLPGPPLLEFAVISIAAVARPTLDSTGQKYKVNGQKLLMETKIRQILRVAGLNGHRRLVLGALGCGVFGNPNREVAEMFLRILKEPEFSGGWWKEITFATYDAIPDPKTSNIVVFTDVLHDKVV